MRYASLFDEIEAPTDGEQFEALIESPGVKIERIVSPPGHRGPEGEWFDQEWDEWVLMVQGAAGIEIEGEDEILELGPGDHLEIPAHCRHRVAWTLERQETIWLAVHYAPSGPEKDTADSDSA